MTASVGFFGPSCEACPTCTEPATCDDLAAGSGECVCPPNRVRDSPIEATGPSVTCNECAFGYEVFVFLVFRFDSQFQFHFRFHLFSF